MFLIMTSVSYQQIKQVYGMYKNSQLDELQGNKFATVFLIPKTEKKKQWLEIEKAKKKHYLF